jgi:hypothetical protein
VAIIMDDEQLHDPKDIGLLPACLPQGHDVVQGAPCAGVHGGRRNRRTIRPAEHVPGRCVKLVPKPQEVPNGPAEW